MCDSVLLSVSQGSAAKQAPTAEPPSWRKAGREARGGLGGAPVDPQP